MTDSSLLSDTATPLHVAQIAEVLYQALKTREGAEGRHARNVASLASWFGEFLSFSEERLQGLYIGGLLHDVGKIGVPDTIVSSPGKLTVEMQKMMQLHAQIGYQLLASLKLPQPVLEVVRDHHEHWDGRGYPNAKRGAEISQEAQIVGICDVWDALRTQLPYKPAWSEEQTVEAIRALRGSQFDPDVVDNFLKFIDLLPDARGEEWTQMYPPWLQ
ncbi:MAG: HD-GYP domain-containing protein [Candidatus Xenobia bacterium]